MKKAFIILFFLVGQYLNLFSQNNSTPEFTWGNASYYNLNSGESVVFESTEIKLLWVKNQVNSIKVGNDTIRCRVSRRTPPVMINGLRIFVADNFRIKETSANKAAHSLLTKDVLICVSRADQFLLNANDFVFPVSFNDGFVWNCDEDSYLFSNKKKQKDAKQLCNDEGIDIDLHDARGIEKHWIVAVENSTVVWISEKSNSKNELDVLLESVANPGIYYLYSHLYTKKLEVRKGQLLEKGEILGTIWGDNNWGHLTFSVIKSDSAPQPDDCAANVLNGFPQFFELYFQSSAVFSRNYRKGRFFFGKAEMYNGNQKNSLAYEDYVGKGWILGEWNIAEKVETISKGAEGNARLKMVLFRETAFSAENPKNYYDYEIHVPDNTYRIRARIGDIELPSWQKIAFENVDVGTFIFEKAQFGWTPERIVKVSDGRLTVRIFVDEKNEKVAGISEIVFQQVF